MSTPQAFSEPPWVTSPSPFYKASHHRLYHWARAWAAAHLPESTCAAWEATGTRDEAVFQRAGADGVLLGFAYGPRMDAAYVRAAGVAPPAGVPAEEWDAFHDFVLVDALCATGAGSAFQALHSGLAYGIGPILHFAGEELKKRVVPDLLAGRTRISLAITEPQAGSDVSNVGGTTARKSEDGRHYVVNGLKKWITGGIYSDMFTVLARTSGKPGDAKGLSFLVVPRTEGVTTKQMSMIGAHATGTTLVEFDEVKVPVENLIGEEGNGLRYCFHNFNHERATIAWIALRFSRVCMEDALAHARRRKVFGKALIEQPVVRHKFAHCAREIEALQSWCETLVYESGALGAAQANKVLGGRTALLKAHAAIVFEKVVRECLQQLGGLGITKGGTGGRLERLYREVQMLAIPGGAENVLLDLGVREELKIVEGKQREKARM